MSCKTVFYILKVCLSKDGKQSLGNISQLKITIEVLDIGAGSCKLSV